MLFTLRFPFKPALDIVGRDLPTAVFSSVLLVTRFSYSANQPLGFDLGPSFRLWAFKWHLFVSYLVLKCAHYQPRLYDSLHTTKR